MLTGTATLADYIDQSLQTIDTVSSQRKLLHAESKTHIGKNRPDLSPDGRWVAFTRPLGEGRETDYFPEGISVIPSAGGVARNVAPTIDRTLVTMAWLPDSRGLILGAPDRTRFKLWVQPLQGNPRSIDLGSLAQVRNVVTNKQGRIAFVASEPHHPRTTT
jgi:hypothetical protein